MFRPIYISQCDSSKKKAPMFKYTTGLEKNKLFIKGNPHTPHVGAIETGLNGNGPKRSPTERDIVRGRLNILFHERPLKFHQGVLT